MSGTRHFPDHIQAQAIALREQHYSLTAVADRLAAMFPDEAPCRVTVWNWMNDSELEEQLGPHRVRLAQLSAHIYEHKLEKALEDPDSISFLEAGVSYGITQDKAIKQSAPAQTTNLLALIDARTVVLGEIQRSPIKEKDDCSTEGC
jgi:hypothetical protein